MGAGPECGLVCRKFYSEQWVVEEGMEDLKVGERPFEGYET